MNRKRFWGLVLVLVIAALAVPTGAQAAVAPRVLQNKTENGLEEGQKLPILSWGKLELENTKLGLVKCENMFAGTVSDPGTKGSGLAAVGSIEGYSAYNCTAPLCETLTQKVEVTPLGQAEEPVTKTIKTVERITVPWEVKVIKATEAEGGKFPGGGKFGLKVGNKLKNEKQIRFRVVCFAQALLAEFVGQLTPETENGSSIGAAPAKVKLFGPASGELESATAGKGSVAGENVKLFGYAEQEELNIKEQ